jgi:hypothetical protein
MPKPYFCQPVRELITIARNIKVTKAFAVADFSIDKVTINENSLIRID